MNLVKIDGLTFYEDKGVLKQLVLYGYDLQKELEALRKYNIDAISVNRFFCGRRINDLGFLADYPFIKRVDISDDDIDCQGLYNLPLLEDLSIKGKKTLDYSFFKHLKILDTRQPAPYYFPDSIETLYIWHMKLKGKDMTSIRFPKALKQLFLYWSDIKSLQGLPGGLERFEIALCRQLTSLSGLEMSADTLRNVNLENCPHLNDYDALYQCNIISQLLIIGCREIPSVAFVKNMKRLQHITLSKTKVMDLDLSPLLPVPSVYYTNYKDYPFNPKDFNFPNYDIPQEVTITPRSSLLP